MTLIVKLIICSGIVSLASAIAAMFFHDIDDRDSVVIFLEKVVSISAAALVFFTVLGVLLYDT